MLPPRQRRRESRIARSQQTIVEHDKESGVGASLCHHSPKRFRFNSGGSGGPMPTGPRSNGSFLLQSQARPRAGFPDDVVERRARESDLCCL